MFFVLEKALARDGFDKAAQKVLYTEIFVQEAFAEIEKEAKETIIGSVEGDKCSYVTICST